jgi:hypothetical protein
LESPNVLECLTDYDCSYSPLAAGPLCDSDGGVCVQCLADPDCLASGLASQGLSHCDPLQHLCTAGCGDNADCVGSPVGSVCIDGGVYPDLVNFCGCGADPDCAGNPSGPHCDIDSSDSLYGLCTCLSSSECSGGEACQLSANSTSAHCSGSCSADADCPANYFCDSTSTCRPRCDTGHGCHGADPVCDSHDIVGLNGKGLSGAVPGAIWCYPCLNGTDCSGNLGCGADTKYSCGSCGLNADCAPGEVCLGDGLCHATCDAGSCPEGELCDTQGTAGNGLDVCYQCISPADCSGGQGCDTLTHGCGTCRGPNADGGPFDCPPDAICSNYWSSSVAGVCLQDCDVQSCPAGELCAVLPALTPDHKYCFGCLQDSDCADGGPGAWCDVSVHLTFACQPGALP